MQRGKTTKDAARVDESKKRAHLTTRANGTGPCLRLRTEKKKNWGLAGGNEYDEAPGGGNRPILLAVVREKSFCRQCPKKGTRPMCRTRVTQRKSLVQVPRQKQIRGRNGRKIKLSRDHGSLTAANAKKKIKTSHEGKQKFKK